MRYNDISSEGDYMELSFSSREELYLRVRPALRAKKSELDRLGFSYIREIDIWNHLIESKWKKSHSLMLSDVVSDILHVQGELLNRYVKKKLQDTNRENRLNQLEVI